MHPKRMVPSSSGRWSGHYVSEKRFRMANVLKWRENSSSLLVIVETVGEKCMMAFWCLFSFSVNYCIQLNRNFSGDLVLSLHIGVGNFFCGVSIKRFHNCVASIILVKFVDRHCSWNSSLPNHFSGFFCMKQLV